MDKNSIVGILIIAGILVVFTIMNKPSREELSEAQRVRDSIERVQAREQIERERQRQEEAENAQPVVEEAKDMDDPGRKESYERQYGTFANAASGEEKFITLENDRLRVVLSNKGGRVYSVELKDYQTYDSLPLILFQGDSAMFGFEFFADNRSIFTNNLFFTPQTTEEHLHADNLDQTVEMRLNAGPDQYIEYIYTLKHESYQLDFDIRFRGMDNLISRNTNYLDLRWEIYSPSLEKDPKNESDYTTVSYDFVHDDVDFLTARAKDENSEELNTTLKWLAFKQQFFSSILVAEENFSNAFVKFVTLEDKPAFTKILMAEIGVPYEGGNVEKDFTFYFLPNHYNTLKKYEMGFEDMIPLGWGIFGWVNKFLIIPVFNFLNGFIASYGLIILLLTLFIKMLVLPLTYKSYKSSAKMRVLKPQVDEINKKFPKQEDAMKKQQATMALYKKVGVSPLGGCLPLLVQLPVLAAMFRFFPASFELRQESFLWAEDLSTYDTILSLPFTVPFGYGDHVSLFTLLMTVSTIIYTKVNSQNTMGSQQMPGMKMMMYFMPIMLLFIFNNYAAGLSYYLLLANVITFGQMALFKRFTDDEAILQKLQANAKKPKKKSKFQERMEKMAKAKGYRMPKK